MECKDCRWWYIVEEDEIERKSLKKEMDKYSHLLFEVKQKSPVDVKIVEKYYEAKEIYEAGWCKRFPPTITYTMPEEDSDEVGSNWYASFPKTSCGEFCGEFMQKK